MTEPILTIVVPCFNEEEILSYTFSELKELMGGLIEKHVVSEKSKILFVDDGSKDNTWQLIYRETLKNEYIRGLKLSRNVGHQNALLAGLFTAKNYSDCLITIDADLQDDIHVISDFVKKFKEGFEIVYGVRKKRKTDTFFKRTSAQWFYKIMKKMGVQLVYNHADFRLMSKRAVSELENFGEINLFLRGIIPLIGFQATEIFYDRKERIAGETKYPLRKMISFALNGITSFSIIPIRFVLFMGFSSFFISLLFAIYFLFLKFFSTTELGWTSLITSIWLIGGLQLIGVGLVGEYIGKIYSEVKRRPKFIVDIDAFNMPLPLQNRGEDYEPFYMETGGKLSETN